MSEGRFKKKSPGKNNAPDNPNGAIRIVNLGVWVLLIAVIMLLAGACIWGICGRIESGISVSATAENGGVVCTVNPEDIGKIKPGMEVRIGDDREHAGYVISTNAASVTVHTDTELKDGVYNVTIITESIRPFKFIVN